MNQTPYELAALGRIIRVIKRFHQQVPNSQIVSMGVKDAYLKQHLSKKDWKFWKQLQADPVELPENKQEPMVEKALTQTQFRHLLGQYRRAGVELYQVWNQSQRQTIALSTD